MMRRPVPITVALAKRLRAMAGKRRPHEQLLLRTESKPWSTPALSYEWREQWQKASRLAELDADVTMYALRHTNIVRQLLDNVPIRLVADHHDTSVVEIERTYSKYIASQGDALVRRALIDFSQPAAENVVSLRR